MEYWRNWGVQVIIEEDLFLKMIFDGSMTSVCMNLNVYKWLEYIILYVFYILQLYGYVFKLYNNRFFVSIIMILLILLFK